MLSGYSFCHLVEKWESNSSYLMSKRVLLVTLSRGNIKGGLSLLAFRLLGWNTMTESNLGLKGWFGLFFTVHWGTAEQEELRPGWRQWLMQRPRRKVLLTSLLLVIYSVCFTVEYRTTSPAAALPHNELSHSLSITEKMPYRLAHSQILCKAFS